MGSAVHAPIELPPSFGESLLWSIGAGSGSTGFLECPLHMSLVVRLSGGLRVAALRHALRQVVRRHAVLSSRFRGEATPSRTIAVGADVPLAFADLGGLDASRRAPIAERLLTRHVERPFELASGGLLRALLVRLAPGEHVLAVVVHHIVFDAGSRSVLCREINEHYAAGVAGRPSALPEPSEGYAGYVRWQRARLVPGREAELLAAVDARLHAAPDVRLPPETEGRAGGAVRCRFAIGAPTVARVRAAARELKMTGACVMLALFTRFVRDCCGSDDVVVAMPISDRRRRDFEELIGLFTNVLLVRPGRPADASFAALAKSVWQALLAAVAEQDLPYPRLLQLRTAAGAAPPPFRWAFNFLSAASETRLTLDGLSVEPLGFGSPPPCEADMALQVRDLGETFECDLVQPADRSSEARVASHARAFHDLVSGVL